MAVGDVDRCWAASEVEPFQKVAQHGDAMDDTATVRMLPCKRARQIKEMATFDLYLHLPRHIVAPAVRERPFEVVRTI